MIYDRPLTVCKLPAGTPLQSRLLPGEVCFYAPREVFHKRFWEAVQAGAQIDRMVEMPLHRDVEAGDYALLENGEDRGGQNNVSRGIHLRYFPPKTDLQMEVRFGAG